MVVGKEVTPRSLAHLAAAKARVVEYDRGVVKRTFRPGRSLTPKLAEAILPHFEMAKLIVHHPDEPLILRLTPRYVAKLLGSPREIIVPEIHLEPASKLALEVVEKSEERRKIAGTVQHRGKEWRPHLILRVRPGFEHVIVLGLATLPHTTKDQLWEDERRGPVKSRYSYPRLRLVQGGI